MKRKPHNPQTLAMAQQAAKRNGDSARTFTQTRVEELISRILSRVWRCEVQARLAKRNSIVRVFTVDNGAQGDFNISVELD